MGCRRLWGGGDVSIDWRPSPVGGRSRRRDRGSSSTNSRSESGFTLVELLVVLIILPLIVGALSLGIITVFSQQAKITGRLSGSMDLQTMNATFVRDVERATFVTNSSSPQSCGTTGTQLLGLAWNPYQVNGSTLYLTSVSYVEVPNTGGATKGFSAQLERLYCTNGITSVPSSTLVVSSDVSTATVPATGQTPQGPPIICQNSVSSGTCSASPAFSGSAAQVAEVDFPVQVPLSSQSFDLVAAPRQGAGGNLATITNFFTPIVLTSPSCGTVLTVNNNGYLYINVNGGTGNGVLTVESPCANSVPNSGSTGQGNICVSAILSGAEPLGTFTNPSNTQCPGPKTPPWYYSNNFTDPYSALQVPPDPVSTGTCTVKSNKYTCSAGSYSTLSSTVASGSSKNGTFAPGALPNFPNNATVIFTGGAYSFVGITPTLPNGSSATFYLGTYKFMNSGTAFDVAANNGSAITGDGALFYAPNGDINFGNNDTVNLTPNPGYLGVSIWDGPRPSCPPSPIVSLTVANNGSDNYGGIYVPCGNIATQNVGALTATFIVASTASFNENTTINVTTP